MARRGALGKSDTPSKGFYANYFEVGHTAFEFVIDFGQSYTGQRVPCHTRIVTSPTYAQALLVTLTKAVGDYQAEFGSLGADPTRRPR
jgi:hypothetical protein